MGRYCLIIAVCLLPWIGLAQNMRVTTLRASAGITNEGPTGLQDLVTLAADLTQGVGNTMTLNGFLTANNSSSFNRLLTFGATNAVTIARVNQSQFNMDTVNGTKVPYQYGYWVVPNSSGSVSNYVRFRGYNPNPDGNKPVVGQPSWYYMEELHYSPDAGDDFMEFYWRDEFDGRQYMDVINKTTGIRASSSIMAPLFFKTQDAATELMSIDGSNFRVTVPSAMWMRGHNSGQFAYTRWYNANNDKYLQIGADSASSADMYLQAGAEDSGHLFVNRIALAITNYVGFGVTAVVPGVKIFRGHTLDNQGTNQLSFSVGGFNGGITNLIPGSIFVQTNTAGPTNTTVATQLLAGSGHTNFAANFFTLGRSVRVNLAGQFSTAATPGTYGFVVEMGGTTIATNDLPVPASLSNMGWELDALITFRVIGSSGAVMVDGAVTMNTNGNTVVRLPLKAATVDTTTTINTTAAQNISVRAHTSVTTAPAQIRCSTGKIYLE
jgi:hypothetical protein